MVQITIQHLLAELDAQWDSDTSIEMMERLEHETFEKIVKRLDNARGKRLLAKIKELSPQMLFYDSEFISILNSIYQD